LRFFARAGLLVASVTNNLDRYMHENPVKRGLVLQAAQWAWSSFRSYAFDEPGAVKLNDWPAAQLRRTA
jgi:hypothetical protein